MFKDEWSSYIHAHFLDRKDRVREIIKTFCDKVSIETHSKVRILRSDNGSEFRNQWVVSFCRDNGIIQEFSAVRVPQQNGESERANRTILETATTMLVSCGLPARLWAEAVNTAVYLRNRVPTSRNPDTTPFEMYFGRRPTYAHLLKFGEEIHVLDHRVSKLKFDPKTVEALMVGYGDRINTYRCYVPDKDEVVVTSDVVRGSHRPKDVESINSESSTFSVDLGGAAENESDLFESAHDKQQSSPAKEHPIQEDITPPPEGDSTEFSIDEIVVVPDRRVSRVPVAIDRMSSAHRATKATQASKISRNNDKGPKRMHDIGVRTRSRALIAHSEPRTYDEATTCEDAESWRQAILDELKAHEFNRIWRIVPKEPGIKEISSRWVFKVKYNADGRVDRLKARLVARGFAQTKGIDYQEVFSPVVRLDSVRLLFSICAQNELKFAQFDVVTAFLNGSIEEDIYLKPPEGLSVPENSTCKLNKSLYGLKQSSRCWNVEFSKAMDEFKFVRSQSDPCVYIGAMPETIYMALYVDDGLVFARSKRTIDKLLTMLGEKFQVKTVNSSCFIGVEIVQRSDGSIFLHQRGYIERVLDKYGMADSKSKATPSEVGHQLNDVKDSEQEAVDSTIYSQAVGSLLYCAQATRPDVLYATAVLAKYSKQPKTAHWNALKRVLRYLKGSTGIGLSYSKVSNDQMRIRCCTDADWAGDKSSRKSMSGLVAFVASGPMSFKSQQQSVVALSTMEAEYIAASYAVAEIIRLSRFIQELKIESSGKPILLCDSQSAIRLIKNPEFHRRSKHIDIRYHFIRDHYERGDFEINYLETENQPADIFTKSLPGGRFERSRTMIGCREGGCTDRGRVQEIRSAHH